MHIYKIFLRLHLNQVQHRFYLYLRRIYRTLFLEKFLYKSFLLKIYRFDYNLVLSYIKGEAGFEPAALEFCRLLHWASLPPAQFIYIALFLLRVEYRRLVILAL